MNLLSAGTCAIICLGYLSCWNNLLCPCLYRFRSYYSIHLFCIHSEFGWNESSPSCLSRRLYGGSVPWGNSKHFVLTWNIWTISGRRCSCCSNGKHCDLNNSFAHPERFVHIWFHCRCTPFIYFRNAPFSQERPPICATTKAPRHCTARPTSTLKCSSSNIPNYSLFYKRSFNCFALIFQVSNTTWRASGFAKQC